MEGALLLAASSCSCSKSLGGAQEAAPSCAIHLPSPPICHASATHLPSLSRPPPSPTYLFHVALDHERAQLVPGVCHPRLCDEDGHTQLAHVVHSHQQALGVPAGGGCMGRVRWVGAVGGWVGGWVGGGHDNSCSTRLHTTARRRTQHTTPASQQRARSAAAHTVRRACLSSSPRRCRWGSASNPSPRGHSS